MRKRIRPCHCLGYWFPHRMSSGTCIHNANVLSVIRLRAKREGLDALQLIADYLYDNPEVRSGAGRHPSTSGVESDDPPF